MLNSQIGVALLGAISGSESAGLYAVAQRGAMLVAFPLAAANAAHESDRRSFVGCG